MNVINKKDVGDLYFLYHLSEVDRKKYLNTWTTLLISPESDTFFTLKEVDLQTSFMLYNIKFNPVCLNISKQPVSPYGEGCDFVWIAIFYIMSIDDSSFTIWFEDKTKEEYEKIRLEMVSWLNDQEILNGNNFIEYCLKLGANIETYNTD
jgi:hypothetical protein